MDWKESYDHSLARGDWRSEKQAAVMRGEQRKHGAHGCQFAHVHPVVDDVVFCEENNDFVEEEFCRMECELWAM